jgi:16S rRNA (cytosine1402-N4)-methyltransferase
MEHITVLKEELVDALEIQSDDIVVDATFGTGGHSQLIAQRLGKKGTLFLIDADTSAFDSFGDTSIMSQAKVIAEVANFSSLKVLLGKHSITKVNAIIADLGWRTDQFLMSGRGFSFNDSDGLFMTFGEKNTYPFTAYDIVNEWEEESISDILFGYGEERHARKIAKHIVTARQKKPIESAKELADIISAVIFQPKHLKRLHPATKTFQALRIAVNDELKVLEIFLKDAFESLHSNGVLAVISFHSLEDRIVKHSFRSFSREQDALLVTKKPIIPTDDEKRRNPRSRSAKLRIIKKL